MNEGKCKGPETETCLGNGKNWKGRCLSCGASGKYFPNFNVHMVYVGGGC